MSYKTFELWLEGTKTWYAQPNKAEPGQPRIERGYNTSRGEAQPRTSSAGAYSKRKSNRYDQARQEVERSMQSKITVEELKDKLLGPNLEKLKLIIGFLRNSGEGISLNQLLKSLIEQGDLHKEHPTQTAKDMIKVYSRIIDLTLKK